MSLSEVARLLWRAIWFPSAPAAVRYKFPQSTAAARPGRTAPFGTGFTASAAVWPRARKPEERSRRRAPERLKCSYTQCPPSCHWRSLKNYVQSWRRWCQAQQKNCISVAVRQFRPGGFQNGKLSAASRNWAVPRVHCSVFEARATTTRLSYRQPTSYKKSPGERVSKDSVQRS